MFSNQSDSTVAPDAGAGSTGRAPVLSVSDLRVQIGATKDGPFAIDGASLTVRRGEAIGLVGESGSGKSMLALSVMRLLPAACRIASGEIALNGRSVTAMSGADLRRARGGEVAMIFQDPMTSLDPTMKIGEQIAEGVRLHSEMSKKEAMQRTVEVLGQVGFPSPQRRISDYPHQLSGGLRQRVMIAMAIACEPSLIIADEPTTALDVTIAAQILDLLDRVRTEIGSALLLISHDLGVISQHTDRVTVMYAGKVMESAPTPDFFTGMRHPYSAGLFAARPTGRSQRSGVLRVIPGSPPDPSAIPSGCRFHPRCARAQERCVQETPPLAELAPGRSAACFFPVETGKGDERPQRASVPAVVTTETAVPQLGSESSDVLLAVTDVHKEYPPRGAMLHRGAQPIQAVSGISFEVEKGETFGIVGESGCGKTTVARMILGLETLTRGEIAFAGTEIGRGHRRDGFTRNGRATRGGLQLMFQDPYSSLDPRMRIESILREPLRVNHIGDRRSQLQRARQLIEEVGLSARSMDRYPHEFSGGQRQRIGLARALMMQPKLLIADEPVSALDVSVQSQVLNLMRQLQIDHSISYVLISHDLAVVRYMADRVGVLYLGKVVEIGPTESVYTAPAHPYTAGLIASVPELGVSRGESTAAISGELPSAANPPSGCRFRTRCPFADEQCAAVEPKLVNFGERHRAACHHPLRAPAPEPDVAVTG